MGLGSDLLDADAAAKAEQHQKAVDATKARAEKAVANLAERFGVRDVEYLGVVPANIVEHTRQKGYLGGPYQDVFTVKATNVLRFRLDDVTLVLGGKWYVEGTCADCAEKVYVALDHLPENLDQMGYFNPKDKYHDPEQGVTRNRARLQAALVTAKSNTRRCKMHAHAVCPTCKNPV